MQENHLFEYAVIRVVPKVEREEFLNVGIVLYCHARKFLQIRYILDPVRLGIFSAALELEVLENNLLSFERICSGGAKAGPIGMMTIRERFRWLTATRSTVLQTSKAHPGFCKDPEAAMHKLFAEMVL